LDPKRTEPANFSIPLNTDDDRSELVLSRRLLDLPLLKADPVLQDIVEAQVVALLARLPKAEVTADAVRRFLAEELSNGQPRLERLAARLHMSARTLHRRLEQEGTNFRAKRDANSRCVTWPNNALPLARLLFFWDSLRSARISPQVQALDRLCAACLSRIAAFYR